MRERGPSLDAWIPPGDRPRAGGAGDAGGGGGGRAPRLGDPVVAPQPRPRPPCPECTRRGLRIEQLEEMLSCFQAPAGDVAGGTEGGAGRRVSELEEELECARQRNAELELELRSCQGHIAQTNAALRSLQGRGVLAPGPVGFPEPLREAQEGIAVEDVVLLKEKALRVLRQIQSQVFDLSGKLEPVPAVVREQGAQAAVEPDDAGQGGQGEESLSEFFS